ncbi:MAG: wax ester/triacylglycerol synthase family O-acyltransferase [Gammaproteobacteria bacterium]|nr:wax ester/triacylglycerol synthase family O-acyltransferase [Gammaproteobacteria bacterium]
MDFKAIHPTREGLHATALRARRVLPVRRNRTPADEPELASGSTTRRPGHDGRVDFATIVDYAAERTRRSPLFRRRVVRPPFDLDHPYWAEDEGFDPRAHLRHASLPTPGGRAELDTEIARIHRLPIDGDGPLWEWWYIDGLETVDGVPPGAFALLFKLHHAAFDGIAAWEVINVSHHTEPGHEDESLSIDELGEAGAPGPREPTRMEMAMARVPARMVDPARAWPASAGRAGPCSRSWCAATCGIRRSTPDGHRRPASTDPSARRAHTARRRSPSANSSASAHSPKARPSTTRCSRSSPRLRRYLDANGELPARSLRVGMPISIRAPGDAGEAGNQVLLAVLPLATDVADPAERLAIHERTRAKKDYVKDVPAHLLTQLMEFVPGPVIEAGVRAFVGSGAARFVPQAWNLIVTNVPASRVPIYLAGAQMLEYDACGPLWDGARLLHVITSYQDVVNISFDVATEHLPDPDRYQQMLRDSMAEMLAAAPA